MGPTSMKKKEKSFCLSEIQILLGVLLFIWRLEPKVTQLEVAVLGSEDRHLALGPLPSFTAASGAGRVPNGGCTHQMPGSHWKEERRI